MPCADSSQCGVFQGCQQWFCNSSKECELNSLSNCWTDVGGSCSAQVVFTQQTQPPVDKDFLAPDGIDFRELASITFTVTNSSAYDLYLDKIPLQLDVQGGGSQHDVEAVKMYQDSGGTERDLGDMYVCLTGKPFQSPANGVLSTCGGSSFARVPKSGGSRRFLIELAFAKEKTYIAGRSYRLRMGSTTGIVFKQGYNDPSFTATMCGIPAAGFAGAWLNAK